MRTNRSQVSPGLPPPGGHGRRVPQTTDTDMTRSLFPLAAALALLLAACAGNPPTNASDTADEGPTIYGQLGVSVDYVEID